MCWGTRQPRLLGYFGTSVLVVLRHGQAFKARNLGRGPSSTHAGTRELEERSDLTSLDSIHRQQFQSFQSTENIYDSDCRMLQI